MKTLALALALVLTTAAPVAAQTVDPLQSEAMMKKLINLPGTAYTFYGPNMTNKVLKDADLPGGEFIRVDVTSKGGNPWDVGGSYPLIKPIKAGDVVFFAIYLRAPNLKPGETALMPGMGVCQDGSPYTPIAMGDVRITNRWNVYYLSAKAATGWPRGQAHVAMQLAADKQQIDLGPVFVLDLGPDYDITTLPHN